ncbi:MAG: hypothetical protein IKE76_01595 [Clostridia bacterium]|nr:hypothetical protein [Clostridia bacterium]
MQKRKILAPADKSEVKTGSLDDACARYSLGRPSMRKVAEDANATIRNGRRVVLNFSKIDAYMDAISM